MTTTAPAEHRPALELDLDDLSLLADALLALEAARIDDATDARDGWIGTGPDEDEAARHEAKAEAATALFDRVCAELDRRRTATARKA